MDELVSKRFFETLRRGQSFAEILTEYAQICLIAQKSEKSLESFNEKKQVETFQQESETWFLLQILLQAKNPVIESEPPKVGFNCSKKSLALFHQKCNSGLNKSLCVKEWLQWIYSRNYSQGIDRTFNFSSQSMWGIECKETIKSSSTEKNLEQEELADPNGNIALCQKAWNLVRSGKEQEAIDLFKYSGQSWRAALLLGHHFSGDKSIDHEDNKTIDSGNPYRNLFQKSLFNILSGTSDFNIYEKAIMGCQVGHLPSILGACQTWEDYLWAHYIVKLENQTTTELENFVKLNSSYFDEDETVTQTQSIMSEEDIFMHLRTSDDLTIRKLAYSPFHYIQSCIILNSINDLIQTLADWAKKITTDQGATIGEGSHQHQVPNSILRFSVHLILLLEESKVWEFRTEGSEDHAKSAATIIQSYVVYLSMINETESIAYYVSLFPELYTLYHLKKIHISTSTYATFLMGNPVIQGKEKEYLQLATDNGLDCLAITSHIVDQILDSSPYPQSLTEDQKVNYDNSLIEQLRWLSYDLNQGIEIIKQSNKLIRRFILNFRPESASHTYDYLSLVLPSNYLTIARDLLHTTSFSNIASMFQIHTVASTSSQETPYWEELRKDFQNILKERIEDSKDSTLSGSIFEEVRKEFQCKLNKDQWHLLNDDVEKNLKSMQIKNAVREHLSLYSYLKSLKLYEEWKEFASQYKSQTFQNEIQLRDTLEASLYHILKYPTGWLLDIPSPYDQFAPNDIFTHQRDSEIHQIRLTVIPNIFLILSDVLSISGKFSQCVELVNLATDDQYKLYSCFPQERLKQFLYIIRNNWVNVIESDTRIQT